MVTAGQVSLWNIFESKSTKPQMLEKWETQKYTTFNWKKHSLKFEPQKSALIKDSIFLLHKHDSVFDRIEH